MPKHCKDHRHRRGALLQPQPSGALAQGRHLRLRAKVRELRIDDDQDCIWLRVETSGGANCHVGYRSCFYRAIPTGADYTRAEDCLLWKEETKVFDPQAVYGDAPNPTQL